MNPIQLVVESISSLLPVAVEEEGIDRYLNMSFALCSVIQREAKTLRGGPVAGINLGKATANANAACTMARMSYAVIRTHIEQIRASRELRPEDQTALDNLQREADGLQELERDLKACWLIHDPKRAAKSREDFDAGRFRVLARKGDS